MTNQQRLDIYNQSWIDFKDYCEKKAKGRCILNNPAWRKLREYHLEGFLEELESPLRFLMFIKLKYPELFDIIRPLHKYYFKLVYEDINIESFPDFRVNTKPVRNRV